MTLCKVNKTGFKEQLNLLSYTLSTLLTADLSSGAEWPMPYIREIVFTMYTAELLDFLWREENNFL